MNATAEKPLIDLSWVVAAGGPEVALDDYDRVIGLPEVGWNSWSWSNHGAGTALSLQVEWTEPTTGQAGTLMAEIAPAEQGVKWKSSFMWYRSGSERDTVTPVRGSGTSSDFNAARIAALAWRPAVSVIDGIQLWTDPASNEGSAIDLASGALTWVTTDEKGQRVQWKFKPTGLDAVLDACCSMSFGLRGSADSYQEMLDQVAEAREQMRAAMRKFLLNF